MKKIIILVLITFSSYILFAQETETTKTKDKTESMSLQKIDEPPIYPGCEGNPKLNICLMRAVQKHISRKFNTDLADEFGLDAGKKRILVIFTINKEGVVENVRARGPHPALEDEAERVVRSLSKMIPGKQKGRPVNVRYSLPINFMIEGDSYNNRFKDMNDNQVPIFPGCDSLAINLPKKCFEDKVTAHIAKNLNKKLANNLDLKSAKKIVYARFTIDKDGKIVDVRTVSSPIKLNGDRAIVLETEVERVINLLPTMKPAKVNDELVKAEYFLTIDFEQKKNGALKIKKEK